MKGTQATFRKSLIYFWGSFLESFLYMSGGEEIMLHLQNTKKYNRFYQGPLQSTHPDYQSVCTFSKSWCL